MIRKVLSRTLLAFCVILLVQNIASAGVLNICSGPNESKTSMEFDVPETVPDNWFPLREVSQYIPIDVSWDGEKREVVIEFYSESPLPFPYQSKRTYPIEELAKTDDTVVIDGVTYCSPRFLARHFASLGFVFNQELWYCETGTDFDGVVTASLLELYVKAPDTYDFVMSHLTGGIQKAESNLEFYPGTLAYTYPYRQTPICYIVNESLIGATLASVISHEAYHVYQARNGLEITEKEANQFEREVLYTLLKG